VELARPRPQARRKELTVLLSRDDLPRVEVSAKMSEFGQDV